MSLGLFVYYPMRPGPNQAPMLQLENSGEIATFVKNFYPIDTKDCVEIMLLGKERYPDAIVKAKGFDYNDTQSFPLFAKLVAEKAEELIPEGDIVLLRDGGKRMHLDQKDIRLSLELHEVLRPKGLDLRDYILLDIDGYISSCGEGKQRYPEKPIDKLAPKSPVGEQNWKPTKTQIDALLEVMEKSGLTQEDPRLSITNDLLEDLQKIWMGESNAIVFYPDARYQPYRDAVAEILKTAKKEKETDFVKEVKRLCLNASCTVEDKDVPVRDYVQMDGGDPRNGRFVEKMIKKHRLDQSATPEIKHRKLLIPYAQDGGASTERVNVSDDRLVEVIENNRLVGLQYFRRDDLNFTEVVEIDLRTLMDIFDKTTVKSHKKESHGK